MSKQATATKKSQPGKRNPKDQIKAFRKAARELGCEDNEERFKDALRTVGKAKLSDKGKKRRLGRQGTDHHR